MHQLLCGKDLGDRLGDSLARQASSARRLASAGDDQHGQGEALDRTRAVSPDLQGTMELQAPKGSALRPSTARVASAASRSRPPGVKAVSRSTCRAPPAEIPCSASRSAASTAWRTISPVATKMSSVPRRTQVARSIWTGTRPRCTRPPRGCGPARCRAGLLSATGRSRARRSGIDSSADTRACWNRARGGDILCGGVMARAQGASDTPLRSAMSLTLVLEYETSTCTAQSAWSQRTPARRLRPSPHEAIPARDAHRIPAAMPTSTDCWGY